MVLAALFTALLSCGSTGGHQQGVLLAQQQRGLPSSAATDAVYDIAALLTGNFSLADMKLQRPPGMPVEVNVTLVISNVVSIDQILGSMAVQGTVVLSWKDSRIAIPEGTDRVQLQPDDVWVPQIDYYNLYDRKDLVAVKLALNRVGSTNESVITHTERFAGLFSFRMNFVYYPFDKHALPVQLELFGNPREYVALAHPTVKLLDGAVSGSLWTARDAYCELEQTTKVTGLTYDRFVARINMERSPISMMADTYSPLVLILLISYTSYYIDPAAVPARTAITIISLLCAITFYDRVAAKMPETSYITWLDVYCILTIVSCCVSIMVFVFVHYRLRKAKQSPPPKDAEEGGTLTSRVIQDPLYLDELCKKWWWLYFALSFIPICICFGTDFVPVYDIKDPP